MTAASTSAMRQPPPPCATCPPLSNTARGPSAQSSRDARNISSIEAIDILNVAVSACSPTVRRNWRRWRWRCTRSSASASVVFGVSSVARGMSSCMSASSASCSESARSVWPDVDTQTGSSTSGGCVERNRALRVRATVRTMSALASMPVLMAATSMSSNTDLSCK